MLVELGDLAADFADRRRQFLGGGGHGLDVGARPARQRRPTAVAWRLVSSAVPAIDWDVA